MQGPVVGHFPWSQVVHRDVSPVSQQFQAHQIGVPQQPEWNTKEEMQEVELDGLKEGVTWGQLMVSVLDIYGLGGLYTNMPEMNEHPQSMAVPSLFLDSE